MTSALAVVPVSFADACRFVTEWHRHHVRPIGHKFSLGVAADRQLVGVAIVGRPVARSLDDGRTLEVTRTAVATETDADGEERGVPNVNSMLYGACWRVSKGLGYSRLITYTQAGETGASIKAAGFRVIAERSARSGWDTPSRRRRDRGTDGIQRYLWEVSA